MSQESGSLLSTLAARSQHPGVAQSPPKAAQPGVYLVVSETVRSPSPASLLPMDLWCSAWWVEAQRTYSGEIASLVIFPRR